MGLVSLISNVARAVTDRRIDAAEAASMTSRETLGRRVNPNEAIGYNYRSYVLALADGRIITGLPVEESADRLVLKTAEGQRVEVAPGDIVEKRASDVSLMPEGLLRDATDQELADLFAHLQTLRGIGNR